MFLFATQVIWFFFCTDTGLLGVQSGFI